MIRFSKIDDNLTIYKENRVVLFGAGLTGTRIKLALEQYGITVSVFCDNDPAKWGSCVQELPVITPEQLEREWKTGTVVQIACRKGHKLVEKQLREMGVNYVSFEEYRDRMIYLQMYCTATQGNLDKEALQTVLWNYLPGLSEYSKERLFQYAIKGSQLNSESCNIICLPPKTGDITLDVTCRSIPLAMEPAVNCWHSLKNIPIEFKMLIGNKKVKLVTAVRDVISQNLSLFFEMNGHFTIEPDFWIAGGDAERLFNRWIAHDLGWTNVEAPAVNQFPSLWLHDIQKMEHMGLDTLMMQDFFEKNFEPYCHIDVFQYPFDKEKGYTVINVVEKNVEIFIYQLERLNDIADELGRFLGIKDFHLINDNVGEEKWYADAYRQAKKEIKFPRAYFDACFNNRVMTHFYSDADIEKFKQRWLPHVED